MSIDPDIQQLAQTELDVLLARLAQAAGRLANEAGGLDRVELLGRLRGVVHDLRGFAPLAGVDLEGPARRLRDVVDVALAGEAPFAQELPESLLEQVHELYRCVDVSTAAPLRQAEPAWRPDVAAVDVVCIDDAASGRLLVERLLARLGLTVLGVGSGAAGLTAIRELRPRVVVLDLHLPDMAGEDVLAALDDEPPALRPRAIVVSGESDAETLARARAAGAAHCLTKPIDLAELTALVEALMPANAATG